MQLLKILKHLVFKSCNEPWLSLKKDGHSKNNLHFTVKDKNLFKIN